MHLMNEKKLKKHLQQSFNWYKRPTSHSQLTGGASFPCADRSTRRAGDCDREERKRHWNMKSGAAGRHKDRTGILSFEPLLGSAIPCLEVVRHILGTQFSGSCQTLRTASCRWCAIHWTTVARCWSVGLRPCLLSDCTKEEAATDIGLLTVHFPS